MRVLIKGLRFDCCAETGLGAILLSHGCSMLQKTVITRPKGASFAGGATHCCAFLWFADEQQCGTVVSVMDGLSLRCSHGPIKALLVGDRDKVSTLSSSTSMSSQTVGSSLSFSPPVAAPVRENMAQSSQSVGSGLRSSPAQEVPIEGAKFKAAPPMRQEDAFRRGLLCCRGDEML